MVLAGRPGPYYCCGCGFALRSGIGRRTTTTRIMHALKATAIVQWPLWWWNTGAPDHRGDWPTSAEAPGSWSRRLRLSSSFPQPQPLWRQLDTRSSSSFATVFFFLL